MPINAWAPEVTSEEIVKAWSISVAMAWEQAEGRATDRVPAIVAEAAVTGTCGRGGRVIWW
jgi:hypothetical protein